MTAPDKVWHEIVTAKDMDELYGFGISPDDWNVANFEEYTRTDLAQAAVAAAYEAAAQVVLGSNLGLDISDIADDVRALATPEQIAALAAERAKMHKAVEALRWYAEQVRLCRLIHGAGDAGRNALAADGGAKATAVLAEIGGA